jgi:hypothetical protein
MYPYTYLHLSEIGNYFMSGGIRKIVVHVVAPDSA